jgi:hypothetical protein
VTTPMESHSTWEWEYESHGGESHSSWDSNDEYESHSTWDSHDEYESHSSWEIWLSLRDESQCWEIWPSVEIGPSVWARRGQSVGLGPGRVEWERR